jgi:hypothetical protein
VGKLLPTLDIKGSLKSSDNYVEKVLLFAFFLKTNIVTGFTIIQCKGILLSVKYLVLVSRLTW